MSDHARLAPSSAGRWVLCPGSVQMEERFPEREEGEAAREGTAIHEVAAKVLQDFVESGRKGHHFKRSDFVNTLASNGVVITNDMLDVAERYIEDVLAVSSRFGGLAKVLVEYRVYMPQIHADNWGTLDGAILFHDHESGVLVVEDLKAGWGVVEVWDNWQLLNYTAGLLQDMINRGHPLPKTIELRLVQPRPYHREGPIRVWSLSLQEFQPYLDRLRASAEEATGSNPRLVTGSHCDNCKARASCPALLQTGYRVMDTLSGIQIADITGESLGKHLTALTEAEKLIKSLKEAMEDKALADIRKGVAVAGWEWVQKETRVKWTVPADQVYAMGDLANINLRKVEPITPKQAVAAGAPDWLVNSISASSPAGVKLVPVNLKAVEKVFKQN